MNQKPETSDPHCPRGYRLLVQSSEQDTEEAFRAWIARVFGEKKCKSAKIVNLFCVSKEYSTRDRPAGEYRDGFRAYVKVHKDA